MTTLVYDPLGSLAANLIHNEIHTPIAEPDVFTNKGPFFANSLIVSGTTHGGVVKDLVYGVDFTYSPLFVTQVVQTGKQIFTYILLADYTNWASVTLQYQALGGNVSDVVLLAQILNVGNFDRSDKYNWLSLTGEQSVYNPGGINDNLSNAGVATLLASKISALTNRLI